MDIVNSRKLQLEINRRLDNLDKIIAKNPSDNISLGAHLELQDLKAWVVKEQVEVADPKTPKMPSRRAQFKPVGGTNQASY